MADEALRAKLIVTDTGPLITLAAADSLEYLLYPDVPVYVPDAVLYAATIKSDALGAQSIAAWVQDHTERVHPLLTQTFANFLASVDKGLTRPDRDMGERAALEAIRYALDLGIEERAVFLTEDGRALSGGFLVTIEDRDRMIPITTRDSLEGLEAAGRINSADQRAEDAGRLASKRSFLAAEHERARKAVETMSRRRPGE